MLPLPRRVAHAALGYARFKDWRLYGEEGLAKREAAIWLQPGILTA